MTNTTAIAIKLNVPESSIVRIEEWSLVMFVVVKGLGARFVSKKVIKEIEMEDRNLTLDYKTEKYSELETIVRHYSTGAWVRVGTFNGLIVAEYRGKGSAVTDEHRSYALAQAAVAGASPAPASPAKPSLRRRMSCLNCGITNTILMGRGYCTDCHGECN